MAVVDGQTVDVLKTGLEEVTESMLPCKVMSETIQLAYNGLYIYYTSGNYHNKYKSNTVIMLN